MITVHVSLPCERAIIFRAAETFAVVEDMIELYANGGKTYLGRVLVNRTDSQVFIDVDVPLIPPRTEDSRPRPYPNTDHDDTHLVGASE